MSRFVTDTLSHAYLPTTDRSLTEKEVEQIHAVDFLAILEPQLAEIQQETAAEPVLQSLTQVIVKGWPEKKDDLLIELHPYFDVRDELAAQDGDLFKGLQCLILPSLRPKIHECLHGAHSGIKKKTMFCASYKKEQPKEPLISHKIPSHPCGTVGSDIFHFDNRDYLCTVDYYSSYLEIDPLKDKTASKVIYTLKRHFLRHEIRNKLIIIC